MDTNVPKTANLSLNPDDIPDELVDCVDLCVQAISETVKNGKLVIDEAGEIFKEYRGQLSMKGQPGIGDRFMKWVHDNQWTPSSVDRVEITKKGSSYEEFPDHEKLSDFDNSDKKFVAVAITHPDKPPILQATDSKWWGWREPLEEVGVAVKFICPEYARKKYSEKIGSGG